MHLRTCMFVHITKYKRIVCDLEGAALKHISIQIKIFWLFSESNIQEKFLLAFTGEGPVHYSHLCAEFECNPISNMCNILSRWCVDGPYYRKMTFTSVVLAEGSPKKNTSMSSPGIFHISLSDIQNKTSVDLQYSPITVARE